PCIAPRGLEARRAVSLSAPASERTSSLTMASASAGANSKPCVSVSGEPAWVIAARANARQVPPTRYSGPGCATAQPTLENDLWTTPLNELEPFLRKLSRRSVPNGRLTHSWALAFSTHTRV